MYGKAPCAIVYTLCSARIGIHGACNCTGIGDHNHCRDPDCEGRLWSVKTAQAARPTLNHRPRTLPVVSTAPIEQPEFHRGRLSSTFIFNADVRTSLTAVGGNAQNVPCAWLMTSLFLCYAKVLHDGPKRSVGALRTGLLRRTNHPRTTFSVRVPSNFVRAYIARAKACTGANAQRSQIFAACRPV